MPPPPKAPPRKLACPVCSSEMTEEIVEGITADVCSEHGIWLDSGELEAIVGGVREAQEKRAKRVVRAAALQDMALRNARREMRFYGGIWRTSFL